MKNQMIKYNNNLITKIKQIFYKFTQKIFGKNKENIKQEKIATEGISNIEKKDKINFIEEIQVDTKEVNRVVEKRDFLKQIDGNVELLEKLSTDRLLKLEKYYDDIILKNELKLKKLQTEA